MGTKMNHKEILYKAASTLNERDKIYGDITPLFENAAQLASIMTGKDLTKYDISVVMEAIKLARRRANPKLADHYIDNVNYTAFSAQFALNDIEGEKSAAVAPQPVEDLPYAQNISVHFDGSSTTVIASPSE
jgi:hypothetical protein